jgi:hypothetical protein
MVSLCALVTKDALYFGEVNAGFEQIRAQLWRN